MKKYIIDGQYSELLAHHGIDIEAVVKKAQLPEDIFSHESITLSEEQYYGFLDAVSQMSDDDAFAIRLATSDRIESFSPPIFAAYCSKNGEIFINRLAQYKKLIGPLVMRVRSSTAETTIEYFPEFDEYELPQFLIESEFAFLVGILRHASQEHIMPTDIRMRIPHDSDEFSQFFGIKPRIGDTNSITFATPDLRIPFISHNDAMWSYFEPELTKRLTELDVDASTSARVRSALSGLLPSGMCNIEDVAEKLGTTKRTLQRKLSEENTTFQKQLNSTRETLALHYIRNTDMSTNDIAYLLGYTEINSFRRAFSMWTGMGIAEYRQSELEK